VDLGQFMAGFAVVLGAVVLVGGARTRRRDGSAPLLIGAALVVGPGAVLLRAFVSVPVLAVSMSVSAAFSVAGAVLLWVRMRRAQA
jgi:hypothetical protein